MCSFGHHPHSPSLLPSLWGYDPGRELGIEGGKIWGQTHWMGMFRISTEGRDQQNRHGEVVVGVADAVGGEMARGFENLMGYSRGGGRGCSHAARCCWTWARRLGLGPSDSVRCPYNYTPLSLSHQPPPSCCLVPKSRCLPPARLEQVPCTVFCVT